MEETKQLFTACDETHEFYVLAVNKANAMPVFKDRIPTIQWDDVRQVDIKMETYYSGLCGIIKKGGALC